MWYEIGRTYKESAGVITYEESSCVRTYEESTCVEPRKISHVVSKGFVKEHGMCNNSIALRNYP